MNETLIKDEPQTLTMEEIERQFDGEWVFLENPVTDDRMEILSGKLLAHSKDRAEVYAKAIELRVKRAAVFYVGESDEEICLNL